MKVVIAGATGFVGLNAVRGLAQRGVEVRGLVRKAPLASEKLAKLREAGASKAFVVDYTSVDELREAMSGVEVLIHLAGTTSQTWVHPFSKSNESVTECLVSAASRAGVARIIYNSGLGVNNENTLGYFVSKGVCESIIKSSGLEYIIFRPSYIVGKGDEFSSYVYSLLIRGEPVQVYGSGEYRLQPIHIDDVVAVYNAAASGSARNRVFDLVGPQPVSFIEYVSRLAEAIGRKPRFTHVSLEEALRDTMRMPSQRKVNTDFSVDDLAVLVSDIVSSPDELCTAFHVNLKSLNELVSKIVGDLARSGSQPVV